MCCKQHFIGTTCGIWKTTKLIETCAVKAVLMLIQMGTRTSMGIRIETIILHSGKMTLFCSCTEKVSKIELKCYGLIWWRKFQDTVEFCLWHSYYYLLLARFIVRIKKKSQKIFLKVHFSQKFIMFEVAEEEALFLKENSIINKIPRKLYWDVHKMY